MSVKGGEELLGNVKTTINNNSNSKICLYSTSSSVLYTETNPTE